MSVLEAVEMSMKDALRRVEHQVAAGIKAQRALGEIEATFLVNEKHYPELKITPDMRPIQMLMKLMRGYTELYKPQRLEIKPEYKLEYPRQGTRAGPDALVNGLYWTPIVWDGDYSRDEDDRLGWFKAHALQEISR